MNENRYQSDLIKKLKIRFPECVILKNDANYLQGIPDLIILWRDTWAALEVKASEESVFQPNQQYYVELLDHMAFAAFIYPANESDVLDELQRSFESRWTARVPQRQ